jgi:hypothetical protein
MRSASGNRTVLGVVLFVPIAALLLTMFACLPAPVGDPENSKVDPILTGAWQGTDPDGGAELVLVRPWDSHTYFVQYMVQSKKDGKEENRLSHYKAWLTSLGGSTFMTFEPLEHFDYIAKDDNDKAWWLVARIQPTAGTIAFRPISPDSPLVKDLDTREKLEAAITANVGKDELYGKEMKFDKLGKDGKLTDAEQQLIKSNLELFHLSTP